MRLGLGLGVVRHLRGPFDTDAISLGEAHAEAQAHRTSIGGSLTQARPPSGTRRDCDLPPPRWS